MIKYRQISIEEREKIYQLLKADISLSKIANQLGRDKSTIIVIHFEFGALLLGDSPIIYRLRFSRLAPNSN